MFEHFLYKHFVVLLNIFLENIYVCLSHFVALAHIIHLESGYLSCYLTDIKQ